MLSTFRFVWLCIGVFLVLLLPTSPLLAGNIYSVSFQGLDFHDDEGFSVCKFTIQFSCARIVALLDLPQDWYFGALHRPNLGPTIKGSAYHGSSMIAGLDNKELFFKNRVIIEAEDEKICPITVSGKIISLRFPGYENDSNEKDEYRTLLVTTKNLSLTHVSALVSEPDR